MRSTQILQYDPLVSDTACHTRSCYLIYLSRKSKTAVLSKTEETYLEACDLLTQTQARKLDSFEIISSEKTDIHKIPLTFLPASASNNKKNSFLAQKKMEVAKATLAFLQTACPTLAFDEKPEIFTFTIPTYSQHIPVFPLYVSTKLMLHYAANEAIPLVVNLKRLTFRKGQLLLDGARSLAYSFDCTLNHFIPRECEEQEEVLAVDMVSCAVQNSESEFNSFLTQASFASFLQAFQKEDLAFLILLCAAAHPAYPPSAKPSPAFQAEPPSSYCEEEKFEDCSPADLQLNLNACSRRELKQLTSLARQYGFFNQAPFSIDHVHASTRGACRAAIAGFLERSSALLAPQEKDLQQIKKEVLSCEIDTLPPELYKPHSP